MEENKKKNTFSMTSIQSSFGALRKFASKREDSKGSHEPNLEVNVRSEDRGVLSRSVEGDQVVSSGTTEPSKAVVKTLKEKFTKGMKDAKKVAKIAISAFTEDASDSRTEGEQVDIFSASVYEIVRDLGSEAAQSINDAKTAMKIPQNFPKINVHNILAGSLDKNTPKAPPDGSNETTQGALPGRPRSKEYAEEALEFDVEPPVPELYDPASVEYLKRATRLRSHSGPATNLLLPPIGIPVAGPSLLGGNYDDDDNRSEGLSEVSLELELEELEEGGGVDSTGSGRNHVATDDENCV